MHAVARDIHTCMLGDSCLLFSAERTNTCVCTHMKRSRSDREVRIEGIRVKNQPMQIMWRQTRRKPLSDRGETLGVHWQRWGANGSLIAENCAFHCSDFGGNLSQVCRLYFRRKYYSFPFGLLEISILFWIELFENFFGINEVFFK